MIDNNLTRRNELLSSVNRIVVKVGSGVLTEENHQGVNKEVVSQIASQVSTLSKMGKQVAIVSSGSVAIGSRVLQVPRHGLSIPVKQAAASLGQGSLISLWGQALNTEGLRVGQILLTHDDLANRRRFLNSRNTINTLFDFNVIPVINENDTVAVHEIKFGDNATLSARITNLVEADLLTILSDVDGLYTSDPRLDTMAKKVAYVDDVNSSILAMAKDSSTKTGLGGMVSKVNAASEAARFGVSTIILHGTKKGSLVDAIKGKPIGTFFFPHDDRISSKLHWIEFSLKTSGIIHVDDGACEALLKKGKSLLASGITLIEGEFESGEAVEICNKEVGIFAKGLCNYHSFEAQQIKGHKSTEIENILGYKFYDEVMHRNDIVFFQKSDPSKD